MNLYLYRAVALEYEDDAYTGEPMVWPGATLGRASGYLSRSSAVMAGDNSGVAFKIVRSLPIAFPKDREVEALTEIEELRQQLRELRDAQRGLRAVS